MSPGGRAGDPASTRRRVDHAAGGDVLGVVGEERPANPEELGDPRIGKPVIDRPVLAA
jgi:hypothetical protein